MWLELLRTEIQMNGVSKAFSDILSGLSGMQEILVWVRAKESDPLKRGRIEFRNYGMTIQVDVNLEKKIIKPRNQTQLTIWPVLPVVCYGVVLIMLAKHGNANWNVLQHKKKCFQAETWHAMELNCPHGCILFLFLKRAPKLVESEMSER